jgi:hypothetical protein
MTNFAKLPTWADRQRVYAGVETLSGTPRVGGRCPAKSVTHVRVVKAAARDRQPVVCTPRLRAALAYY